jgi:phosphohistidine phosphatase
VLCSSARRAQETLAGIAEALGEEVSVQVEPELYGASQRDLLERLRAVPDAAQSAMVIGHNPAVQMPALTIARTGDELERIQRKFPTGGLATFTFDCSWRKLERHAARLARFVTPKDLG